MFSTEEIANLNYLFIILSMNSMGFLYFYFSPARQAMELRPSVICFMVMFALIAVAFLVFASRVFVPPALSLTLANILFLLSAYYAKSGFMYRSGKTPPPLKRYYLLWANIALITIINTGVFYYVVDNFAMRATITHCNVALVFYSAISMVKRDPENETAGEKVAKFALWSVVIFTPLAAILHWLDQSFFTYMSALMLTQAIAVTALMGGILTLLMSDLIEDHYHNSVTDPLTGVYNRRFFVEKAPKMVGFLKGRFKQHFVIAADIDDFKRINDKYGHLVGDEALVSFANLLTSHVRSTDVVARFGGEEFVVLLPNSSEEMATILANRLCTAVSNYDIQTSSGVFNITASFGVASLNDAEHLSDCLESADKAMYEAKRKGKNRVVVSFHEQSSK